MPDTLPADPRRSARTTGRDGSGFVPGSTYRGGLCLALASFVVYLLFAQDSAYGDAPAAIVRIETGGAFRHSLHFLYLPIVAGMYELLGWTGLSLFEVGRLTSALGMAIGIAFLHAAGRRLTPDPLEAVLVAALVASCPAVVFFATTMEYHGPFFALASAATYAMARWVGDPRWPWAMATGFATASAYFAHATGHLLPGLLLLCFLVLSSRRDPAGNARSNPRWWWPPLPAGMFLLTHVLVAMAGNHLIRLAADVPVGSDRAAGYFTERVFRHLEAMPATLPQTVWYELIWPYLPMSIVWLWGLRRPALRPLIGVLLLCGAVYLAMCVVLVPGFDEHGAYQLPLAWLLALIVVRSLSRPWVFATIGIGLGLAVLQVRMHDDPGPARAYARGVREVAAASPLCLVIGMHFVDHQATALYLRDIEVFDLDEVLGRDAEEVRAFLPVFDAHVHRRLEAGGQVVFSAGAYDMLGSPIVQAAGGAAVLKAHVDSQYRLEPVSVPGFAGWRLLRRH